MKRFILLLLALMICISFSGCLKPKYESDGTEIVILPDLVTKQTVNGYKQDSVSAAPETNSESTTNKETQTETSTETSSCEYVANKSTKKFHLSSCQYAKKIKSENLVQSNSRTEFTNNGYEACKKCNP